MILLKRNGVFGKRIEIFVPKKVDTLPKRIENRTSVFYLIVNVNRCKLTPNFKVQIPLKKSSFSIFPV